MKLTKSGETFTTYVDLIQNDDLWFITEEDKLYDRRLDKFYSKTAYYDTVGITESGDKKAFMELMRQLDRVKRGLTSSLRKDVSSDLLNLQTTKGWIEPVESDNYAWQFDVLMDSLSTGREEVREHIERCILWKFMEPGDYQLPALCLYGEENSGKTTLGVVLGTIFTEKQVLISGTHSVYSDFNDPLKGKLVVLVEEGIYSKANQERTKLIVCNPTITINAKHRKELTVDNTIWFVFGTNDVMGPVKLGLKGNRRFSLVEVRTNIWDTIEKFGHTREEWLAEYDKVFRNKEEVGKWIYHLVLKYSESLTRPMALHGEDFEELLEDQHAFDGWLIEELEEAGSTVSIRELYDRYKQEWDNTQGGANWTINFFSRQVYYTIRVRKLHWGRQTKSFGGKSTRCLVRLG